MNGTRILLTVQLIEHLASEFALLLIYEALSRISADSINLIRTMHTFWCNSVLRYCFSWSEMRRLMLLLFLCANRKTTARV